MDYAIPLSCRAASATLVFYDWLITLDWEVDLIWPRRLSPAKFLFIFNRYFGPLCLVLVFLVVRLEKKWPDNFCHTWFRIQNWFMGIIVWIWLLQFAMLHRTFAIYSNTKQIKALLIGGYVLGLSATLVILIILTTTFNAQKSMLSLRPIECYVLRVPSYAAIFWIPALIYKLVFIAVAMRVSIKHARLVNWLGRNHIMTWAGFVKDSIFYFFLTSSLLVINAVIWLTLSPQWFRIFEGFSIAAICAAGNRLVFKLVELYYDPHEDDHDEDGDIALQNLTAARGTAAGIYEQVVHERNSDPSIVAQG